MADSGDQSPLPPPRNPQSPLQGNASGRNGGRSSSRGGRGGRIAPIPVPRPGSSSSAERKRRRGGDPGAGPSVPPQQRAPVPPPPQEVAPLQPGVGAFPCALCDMTFDSDKSLAGHMRMHPDRPWRGMHPPPTFTREDFADVEDLLNPEHDEEDEEEEDVGGGAGRNNNVNLPDLNKTPSPPSSSA